MSSWIVFLSWCSRKRIEEASTLIPWSCNSAISRCRSIPRVFSNRLALLSTPIQMKLIPSRNRKSIPSAARVSAEEKMLKLYAFPFLSISARSSRARTGSLQKFSSITPKSSTPSSCSAFRQASNTSSPVARKGVYLRSNLCEVEQKRQEFWHPTPGMRIPAFPSSGAP